MRLSLVKNSKHCRKCSERMTWNDVEFQLRIANRKQLFVRNRLIRGVQNLTALEQRQTSSFSSSTPLAPDHDREGARGSYRPVEHIIVEGTRSTGCPLSKRLWSDAFAERACFIAAANCCLNTVFAVRFSTEPAYISWMKDWRISGVRAARGFIEPCLPSLAKKVPEGPNWVYEIKHDGYRLMVRREHERIRIYSRRGADFTNRFPRIVASIGKLTVQSVMLDGEAIFCDEKGLVQFVHSKQHDAQVKLRAFDILELDGKDLRPRPLVERKAVLARLLKGRPDGIEFSEYLTGDGWAVFQHACRLGCEGVVAKRVDLGYESGRSKRWIKIKNPDAPPAKRIEEGLF